MDFYETNDESELAVGEISDLFREPVLPKIVIVGLGDEPTLQLFKEILVRTLDNLFVVEFSEQVNYKNNTPVLINFSVYSE